MSKLKRNIVCVALFLFATVLSLCGVLVLDKTVSVSAATPSEYTQTGNYISNEYLKFQTNESRYAFHTTGGDPNSSKDNNQRLLYGSISSGTSRTIININGNTSQYSYYTSYKNAAGTSIYSSSTYSGVLVEQIISFSYNTYTSRYDTVEIKYVMTNTSTSNKTAGARIFFDTMLGNNDSAPFRVPYDLTREQEFVGDAIPSVWQAFDSLTNPTVVGSGTFYTNVSERPDKVQFIRYGSGSNTYWNNSINNYSFGDSAINIYYNPITLAPGESRTVRTFYGLSAFVPSQPDPEPELQGPQFDLQAIAPAELLLNTNTNTYEGNPFSFNSWLSNTGDSTATNVKATLQLPSGLTASNLTVNVGTLAAGANKNIAWNITAEPTYVERTYTYKVLLTGNNMDSREYTYTIRVPALRGYGVTYDANGGFGGVPVDNTMYQPNASVSVAFYNLPTRTGYKFLGWSTNPSATVPTYTADGTRNFIIYESVVLYAVWTEVHVHTDGQWVVQSNPTCTTSGVKALTCATCGEYIRYSYVPAYGHDYVSEVIREATCTEMGLIRYTCNNCNHSYDVTVNAEHNYVLTVREATCTVDGAMIYTCSTCGDIYTTVIPASHSYIAEVIRLATRDEDGLIRYTCENCGEYYEEIVPASDANVLLIQDRVPWSVDNVPKLLNKLVQDGYIAGWSATTTSQFSQVNLAQYSVVYIANDQTTATYNQMAQLTDALTAFANAGGVVVYGACDNGWAGGEIRYTLPGGVEKIENISRYNYILDNAHPIVTGSLTDDKALTNALLNGTYCSHTSFRESTLPADYNVILQDGYGNPTLAEYPMGNGKIIVSGLTWEFYYSRIYQGSTSYSKNVFDDLIVYAASLADYVPCDHVYDDGVEVAATCTTEGYILHTCTICQGTMKDNFVPALGHDMGVWVIEREATCETSGLKSQTCNRCHERVEEIIPAGQHTWTFVEEIIEDCLAEYIAVYQCDCCEGYLYLTKPAKGNHIYDNGTVVDSTCTEDGYTLYTCTTCGGTKRENIVVAPGHDISDWVVETEATCEADGLKAKTCSHCEYREEEVLPMLGHDMSDWVVEVEVTCEADGLKAKTCSRCTHREEEILPMLGHDMSDWVVEVVETCETDGLKAKTCSRCTHREEEVLPMLGHDMSDWVVEVEATCEIEGLKAKTCSRCTHREEEVLPMLVHHMALVAWQATTCTQYGYKLYECANCHKQEREDETELLAHTFSTWRIIQDATCEQVGLKEGYCEVHKGWVTVEIAQLEHVYEFLAQTSNGSMGYFKVYQCRVCAAPSAEHYDGQGNKHSCRASRTQASCTAAGEIIYTCEEQGCEKSGRFTYETTWGHNFVTTEEQAATCTANGYRKSACTRCGSEKTDTLRAKGHNYVKEVHAATCTQNGYDRYTCSRCNDWYKVDIPATGHNHVLVDEQAPTCTENGYKLYRCNACADEYQTVLTSYGHNMDGGVCVKPSTCTEAGLYQYTCLNDGCGYVQEVSVAESHKPYHETVAATDATCTTNGLTAGIFCNECNDWYQAQEVIPALGHDVKLVGGFPAGCYKAGLTDGEYCERCSTWLKERVEIPGGHIESDWIPVYENGKLVKEEKTCTRCGEQLDIRIPYVDDETNEDDKPGLDVDIHDNEVNVEEMNVGCSGVIGMAGILPCSLVVGSLFLFRRRRNDSIEE